jgi:glutamine synthetase
LLKFTGIEASHVYTTLGTEQEYFIIDRALRNLRPDLILTGRTVFGAPSPKGQELQDHYFGVVKDRILAFMRHFEKAALQLAIPVKTRHNEVAPAQHEIAPVFEKASLAVDHNILMMELMRQTAAKHGLSCLLHEKPFHDINGSGKHCNWSLATDMGLNLLDPSEKPENNLHFLILLTAILHAVHKHALLLRASIGSASNDYRLGGHEAPPAIISVYLGDQLEAILNSIEEQKTYSGSKSKHRYDFGLPVFPDMTKDYSDRNRTSPFAFTGNKFEFRAVGSSSNVAMPITVLNAIVAESLNEIMDKIERTVGVQSPASTSSLLEKALPIIKEHLVSSKNIRFSGDNYSVEWREEAKKRHIPNFAKSIDAFEAFISTKTKEAFKGILTPQELDSYYDIQSQHYFHTLNIEVKVALDMFKTQIFPAALQQQKLLANSLKLFHEVEPAVKTPEQKRILLALNKAIENALKIVDELENTRNSTENRSLSDKLKIFGEQVQPKFEELRNVVDALESLIEDSLWPLPKYRELLFMV